MNDALADEVKKAKKDKHVAVKLYKKTKGVASTCRDKLLTEREAKNNLEGELTQALKAQQV
jgi:hypothetical protein